MKDVKKGTINIQDEILESYEVRKSNEEKAEFIDYLTERLTTAGYESGKDITVEEKGKGLFMSRNIVVGDPKSAKILIGAHYDTCAMLPFPNLMSPTNPVIFILAQIFLTIVIFVMAAIVALLAAWLMGEPEAGVTSGLIFLYVFMFYMLFGYRNKHTANDNTSGIITITRILEGLPEEDRSKVCAIYFDNEEKGLFGSDFFYRKHRKEVKDKLLLNFDCVGDGQDVVFLAKRKAGKDDDYAKLLEVAQACESDFDVEFLRRNMKPMMFGSDQMHFPKGVGVCALRKSPIGRYVARIHTPLDTRCRAENIEYLRKVMLEYLKL